MLVLDRTIDESIIINGNIEVMLISTRLKNGIGVAKLGITAPKSVSIHRKEIQEAIDKERRSCGVGSKGITAVGLQS